MVRLYLSEKYTTEEIEFNKLNHEVTEAIDDLKTDIDRTTTILKKYGFKREDIETFITDKVKWENGMVSAKGFTVFGWDDINML